MKLRRLLPLLGLSASLGPACAEDEPAGVVVEVRYGPSYDGSDGAPGERVPGAEVMIRSPFDVDDPGAETEYARGTADEDGRFIVDAIEEVQAFISASEPGNLGPAGCEWTGAREVMLLDAGETVELELDQQICT